MSTLTIKKIDETTISVSSDTKGVINELSDFFSFYAPGYKYDKRFQNHIWDGRIRLVNLRTETAPQGLTSNIIKFCNDRGYQFIDETEKYLQNVVDDISNIDQWIEDLKLPFSPRDYQIAAVKQAIRSNKTMLISATGSGKSCIIYLIVRWMLEKDRKVCLIVPSTSLVEQMLSDFKDYSKLNGWDVDKHVRGLYSKIKTTDPYEDQCVITTWQSICKYDNQLFESWDCVMVDECFDGNMRVLTPTGYVPIKDIKIGDTVINFDETTGEFKQDRVVDVYCNMPNSWSEKMLELQFDDGTIIKVTANHKFLTKNRGWVRADQLTGDDDIETLSTYSKD